MITVKIGTTIFLCETPAEAIQIHRLAGNQASTATVTVTSTSAAVSGINGGGPEVEFFRKLQEFDGQDIDSDRMAKLLGTESRMGVGPRLAKFRRDLEAQHIILNETLVPKKSDDGTVSWAVRWRSA